MPAAAASALRPMATRTPLMAITAVQALCRIAKTMLGQLRNLTLVSNIFSREASALAGENCVGLCARSVMCELVRSSFVPAPAQVTRRSLGAGSAAHDPNSHLCHGVPARKRGQRATRARIPAPAYKIIGGNMLEQFLERAAAGLCWIFQLAAEVWGGASDENHFVLRCWKRPRWISRRHVCAREVCGLVAGVATHAVDTVAVFAAFYVLEMDMAVVALQWCVAGGVAVLAARRCEYFVDLQKCFARSIGIRSRASRRSLDCGDHQHSKGQSAACGRTPNQ
jgi:hypothetical protein